MRKIYSRQDKNYYEEKQFMKRELSFLYHTAFGRLLLNSLVSKRWFSSAYTRRFYRKKSVRKINPFIEKYNIDMSEYPARTYSSFSDFFTHTILPEKRPISPDKNQLISPADAKLLSVPIDKNCHLSIKGSDYTLNELLGNNQLGEDYINGTCLVFRLTVDDYHRYIFIDDGKVISKNEIPGKLHTVGPFSNGMSVLQKNHRIVTGLATENFVTVTAIEVGALMVGRINNHQVTTFKKGEEKGFFSYGGSTILLLFKENIITLDSDIEEHSKIGIETKVLQGGRIGKRK